MTTLADKSLISGGDNKPPMLEKHLYDSWKSRMELYMLNSPHGRMILASIEIGPLVGPTITVNAETRLMEYTELTSAETTQADCDIKAINIILQGIPPKIYALVSQHRVAKDIWEKIQLQGTSLTKQERECSMLLNLDQLGKQLDKEGFHETGSMDTFRESIQEREKQKREHDKRMNNRMMQSKEGKVDLSKALDAGLVVTESSRTESDKQDTSSR
nr:hypothetical protein [Tanacetum cinerariifolium]GEZ76969.1 hypothetical protein [Tanacetum cinerariifolium]